MLFTEFKNTHQFSSGVTLKIDETRVASSIFVRISYDPKQYTYTINHHYHPNIILGSYTAPTARIHHKQASPITTEPPNTPSESQMHIPPTRHARRDLHFHLKIVKTPMPPPVNRVSEQIMSPSLIQQTRGVVGQIKKIIQSSGQLFARTLQSVKNLIYIEYREKWSKLQLFQIKNGFFKKISPLQTFFLFTISKANLFWSKIQQ